MDGLVLLCKSDSEVFPYKLRDGVHFVDLFHTVCSTLRIANRQNVTFKYSVPGYKNCVMSNEEGFNGMIELVKIHGINKMLEVEIVLPSSECMEIDNIVEEGGEIDLGASNTNIKTLLSASWSNLISHVDQKFEGGVETFRIALQKYSVEKCFSVFFERNTKQRVVAYCMDRFSDNCNWHVSASLSVVEGCFVIKKLVNEHSCSAKLNRESNNCTANMVASLIKDKLTGKQELSVADVINDMREHYGLTVSYHKAWMAINKARQLLFGDVGSSYKQLQWYTKALLDQNPGSHIVLEVDNKTNSFIRLFVSFEACISGFKFVRPMLFIDGTHLKSTYKGVMLSATGKNGNQGLYPLAFAVVDAENKQNWIWFLNQLNSVVGDSRQITFVSDRHVGLVEAMPLAFPDAKHLYCYVHLRENLKSRFRGSGLSRDKRARIMKLFKSCAYANTVFECNDKLKSLLIEGGDNVREFIEGIPVEKWTNAYSGGSRYGEMTSNAAESFNQWTLKCRNLPITEMIDQIRVKMMNQFMTRRTESVKWNTFLCKEMEGKWQQYSEESRTWTLTRSSESMFEVFSDPSYCVDLKHRTCDCNRWQLDGFPCVHAVLCIKKFNLHAQDYVDYYFQAKLFSTRTKELSTPVPTSFRQKYENFELPDIVPPSTKRAPGRPRKLRLRSHLEGAKKARSRMIVCGRFKKKGNHSKTTCKEPI